MSRTMRRKNEKWLRKLWALPKHEILYDNTKGRWSPPRWYCQLKDRPKKRFNSSEMHKVLRDPDYEPLFRPLLHDAGYEWW
jgi:hypothetical protein